MNDIKWKLELIGYHAFGWIVVFYNGASYITALVYNLIQKLL